MSTTWMQFFFNSNLSLSFSLHTAALPEYNSPECSTWQNVFVHTIVPYTVKHLLHPSLEGDCISGVDEGISLTRVISNQVLLFQNER